MKDNDLGATPRRSQEAGSIAPDSASHVVPTIQQMRANYDKFCAAVDKEALTLATTYAAVCADHIEKLLKVLESGEYALVPRVCPCEDGLPDPCPACGASAATGICGAMAGTGNQSSVSEIGSLRSEAQK